MMGRRGPEIVRRATGTSGGSRRVPDSRPARQPAAVEPAPRPAAGLKLSKHFWWLNLGAPRSRPKLLVRTVARPDSVAANPHAVVKNADHIRATVARFRGLRPTSRAAGPTAWGLCLAVKWVRIEGGSVRRLRRVMAPAASRMSGPRLSPSGVRSVYPRAALRAVAGAHATSPASAGEENVRVLPRSCGGGVTSEASDGRGQ
jgi:hypothetical protein